ncbi:MAG: homoserine dehydrogenase [Acidobacteria bacterium]|nr:homoserine dehydrogenase [Acidobacteriota bacterium]
MQDVNLGIVGLGNVGSGTLTILSENAGQIARKLGFRLNVAAVCSRSAKSRTLPEAAKSAFVTEDWGEVVNHPGVDVVAELIGGTTVAREVVEGAIAAGKSVVTANKELIALDGAAIWQKAAARGVTLAMEASVCGGIPIHAVLREGIAGDRVETLFGILNGTSNYILTEIEQHGSAFDDVLAEAQKLGYAEADPTADVDGFDARSKLALLASLAFGVRLHPDSIHTEGIRRVSPIDFQYARQLGCTIKLLCSARRDGSGLFVSVRSALLARNTIMAGVQGAYNAVWCRGAFGADTFYYGRGAGPNPTGVAVVSDLMRVARELRPSPAHRVPPFAFTSLEESAPLDIGLQKRPWYLRFRITDRPGIIRDLSSILAEHAISIDAVLQLPDQDKHNLPFVITLESSPEAAVRRAVEKMSKLDFMVQPPLALPIERGL